MFVIGITPRVYAGFSSSEIIGLSPADRPTDLKKVQKFLEMKMVGERLREFGFTTSEIKNRLGELDDQQVHALALRIDDLKVGTDGAFEVLVALAVIVLLVILLIYLLQHRVVIK